MISKSQTSNLQAPFTDALSHLVSFRDTLPLVIADIENVRRKVPRPRVVSLWKENDGVLRLTLQAEGRARATSRSCRTIHSYTDNIPVNNDYAGRCPTKLPRAAFANLLEKSESSVLLLGRDGKVELAAQPDYRSMPFFRH